jgi:hypothetical protein
VFDAEESKLVLNFYFSMVMNDGKQRKISHSVMQKSIDDFLSHGDAKEIAAE